MIDTAEQVETEITAPEEKVLVGEKITFQLGRIDEVHADAVVCPQDSRFAGEGSQEKQLLMSKYGIETFEEASKISNEYLDDLNRSGQRRQNLPMGFARSTNVGENERGVKEIVHVNFNSQGEGTPDETIKTGVANALREASLYPKKGIESVAIPLPGGVGMAEAIKAVCQGVENHFTYTPHSTLKKIVLVVNGDNNEQNRQELGSMISSVTQPA